MLPKGLSAGFPSLDGYTSDAEVDTRKLVKEQNRKKKKSGGFQSMGKLAWLNEVQNIYYP